MKNLTKSKKCAYCFVPGRLEQLANFLKSHSGGRQETGGGGSSLDGKRSRVPGVCACAEVPVSGATCAAALRAHCAHTQLICESAVQMSSGANAHNTAWRVLMVSKGLSGAVPVLEGYGLSCEHDLSLLVQIH